MEWNCHFLPSPTLIWKIMILTTLFQSQPSSSDQSSSKLVNITVNISRGTMDGNLGVDLTLEKEDFPLTLSCVTNEPSQWIFRGHGKGNPVHVKRQKKLGGKFSSLLIIPTSGEERIGLYSCQLLRNTEISESVYIFIKDKNQSPHFLTPRRSLIVQPHRFESILLPCPVSSLSIASNPGGFHVNNYGVFSSRKMDFAFEPKSGFLIDNLEDKKYTGKYRCINEANADDYVDVEVKDPIDFYVKPQTDQVFASSNIELKCSSLSEIFLIFDDGQLREAEVTYSFQPDQPYRYTAVLRYTKMRPGDKGRVSCIRKNNRIVHSWYFEQTDTETGLSMARPGEEGRVTCRGIGLNFAPEMCSVSCKYSDECMMAPNCTATGLVFDPEPCSGCSSISISKYGGNLLSCNAGGTSFQEMYFHGLDGQTYTQDAVVPVGNMIAIELNPSNVVMCKWIPFHLAENVMWSVQFLNGSTEIFKTENEVMFHDNGILESSISIQSLHHLISTISCSVPYWTSVEGKRAHSVLLIANLLTEEGTEMRSANEAREREVETSTQPMNTHSSLPLLSDLGVYLFISSFVTTIVISFIHWYLYFTITGRNILASFQDLVKYILSLSLGKGLPPRENAMHHKNCETGLGKRAIRT